MCISCRRERIAVQSRSSVRRRILKAISIRSLIDAQALRPRSSFARQRSASWRLWIRPGSHAPWQSLCLQTRSCPGVRCVSVGPAAIGSSGHPWISRCLVQVRSGERIPPSHISHASLIKKVLRFACVDIAASLFFLTWPAARLIDFSLVCR